MKNKIYFDMDGVLAKWNPDATIEEVATKGYFTNCAPEKTVIEAANLLIEGGYEVHILSSVFQDNHSKDDKKEWLERYLPNLPAENMHFVAYGHSKDEFVNPGEKDVLIDDFTPNLLGWTGRGIKMYNGINGSKGRWRGYSVHSSMHEDILYNQIAAIAAI